MMKLMQYLQVCPSKGPWIIIQDCHALWYEKKKKKHGIHHNAQQSCRTIQEPVVQDTDFNEVCVKNVDVTLTERNNL